MLDEDSLVFEYKPAPIGGARRVVVDAAGVRVFDKEGELRDHALFADVDTIRFVTWSTKYGAQRRLELVAMDETFRIGLNGARDMNGAELPLSEFFAACEATLIALGAEKPELEVSWGEGSRMRWLWFSMGLAAVLFGIGLPIAALIANVRIEKLLGALVPTVLLVLFGLAICSAFRPWRQAPKIPIKVMTEAFRSMRNPDGEERTETAETTANEGPGEDDRA